MTAFKPFLVPALLLALAAPAAAQSFHYDGGRPSGGRELHGPRGSDFQDRRIGGDRGFLQNRRFLRDGGSIRFEQDLRLGRDYGRRFGTSERLRDDRRFRDVERLREDRRFENEGRSVTRLREGLQESPRYGRRGDGDISVIYLGTPPEAGSEGGIALPPLGSSGPKIIDVASARLDRRPYGESGIDTVYSGTAKIIRIAPGYRRGGSMEKDETFLPKPEGGTDFAALSPSEQAMTVYPDRDAPSEEPLAEAPAAKAPALPAPGAVPVPTQAPEEARQASRSPEPAPAAPPPVEAAKSLEPWTAEWLRDCVARYPSFDASLGTYQDEGGRRHFCTGEP